VDLSVERDKTVAQGMPSMATKSHRAALHLPCSVSAWSQ